MSPASVAPGAEEFHLHRTLESFQLEKPSESILVSLGQCSGAALLGTGTPSLQGPGPRGEQGLVAQFLQVLRVLIHSQHCCSELKTAAKHSGDF